MATCIPSTHTLADNSKTGQEGGALEAVEEQVHNEMPLVSGTGSMAGPVFFLYRHIRQSGNSEQRRDNSATTILSCAVNYSSLAVPALEK